MPTRCFKIKFCGLITALVSLIFSVPGAPAQTWQTVKWVYDGDTIFLTAGNRIRYIGINAPEIDHEHQQAQPYGYQAKSFNKNLILSKRIRLEYDIDRHDRYGRELAYIFLEDGTFVNARLLKAGMAFYLYRKPNLKYDEILLKAQQEAMARKTGIWQHWREDGTKYVGNRNSRRFHLFSCPRAAKINAKNLIHFSSKWDAFRHGYAPSKKCIPEFWSYGKREE
jgi:endonuclease YncB( thermonuclease family)